MIIVAKCCCDVYWNDLWDYLNGSTVANCAIVTQTHQLKVHNSINSYYIIANIPNHEMRTPVAPCTYL